MSSDPQYLSAPEDLAILRRGVEATRQRLRQASLVGEGNFLFAELFPSFLVPLRSKAMTELYCKLFSSSYFHGCGGCRMVPYDSPLGEGVVTPDLKVRGVKNLRIADASVFPAIPSGPIAAACAAIGIGAAECIRKEAFG